MIHITVNKHSHHSTKQNRRYTTDSTEGAWQKDALTVHNEWQWEETKSNGKGWTVNTRTLHSRHRHGTARHERRAITTMDGWMDREGTWNKETNKVEMRRKCWRYTNTAAESRAEKPRQGRSICMKIKMQKQRDMQGTVATRVEIQISESELDGTRSNENLLTSNTQTLQQGRRQTRKDNQQRGMEHKGRNSLSFFFTGSVRTKENVELRPLPNGLQHLASPQPCQLRLHTHWP